MISTALVPFFSLDPHREVAELIAKCRMSFGLPWFSHSTGCRNWGGFKYILVWCRVCRTGLVESVSPWCHLVDTSVNVQWLSRFPRMKQWKAQTGMVMIRFNTAPLRPWYLNRPCCVPRAMSNYLPALSKVSMTGLFINEFSSYKNHHFEISVSNFPRIWGSFSCLLFQTKKNWSYYFVHHHFASPMESSFYWNYLFSSIY